MPTKAKIILDTRYQGKQGYPIKIRITNKGTKYIPLGLYSMAEDWDDGNVIGSHPDYRKLNNKITKRKLQLLQEIEYCNDNELDLDQSVVVIENGIQDNKDTEIYVLKQKIARLERHSKIGLLEFFDVRIREKIKVGESVSHYINVKNIVKNFSVDDINMNQVTYEWLNSFVLHQLSGRCNRAGVNSYLETIRAVYKEAQRRGSLMVKQDNPFIGHIKPAVKRPIIKIDSQDLQKLISFNPEKSPTRIAAYKQKRNVALWLFQFYIGGHDYVDIALLKWSDIKEGRVRFKRYKNRNKPDGGMMADNRLFREAREIISAYGTPKNRRIFGFIPDPVNFPKKYIHYRKNVNRSLRIICEKLDIDNPVKTKSPRYVFRTRAGELKINDFTVMQIQAHKAVGITFNYQLALPYRVIDKAHRKIIRTSN